VSAIDRRTDGGAGAGVVEPFAPAPAPAPVLRRKYRDTYSYVVDNEGTMVIVVKNKTTTAYLSSSVYLFSYLSSAAADAAAVGMTQPPS